MSQPRKSNRVLKPRPLLQPGARGARRRGVFWPVVGAAAGVCLLLLGGVIVLAARKPSRETAAPQARAVKDEAAEPSRAQEASDPGVREAAVIDVPIHREKPPASGKAGAPAPPKPPRDPRPSEGPPPVAPWRPTSLTADEIKEQLRAVPELDFYPKVEEVRKEAFRDAEARLKRLKAGPQGGAPGPKLEPTALAEFVSAVTASVLEKAAPEGLAVSAAPACKVDRPTACVMQGLSTAMRGNNFAAIPGTKMDAPTLARFERWWRDHPIENRPGTRRILMQMLQVEGEPQRRVLVEELGKGNDAPSAAALARLAAFDPSPDVRRAAVEALKKCPAEVARAVLLNAIRYPWPPAADHAAEALIGLGDRMAIPALVGLLDQPDPARPVADGAGGKPVVRELVRLNHMRSCYLCHPAAPVLQVPVGGVVPRPGEALPGLYYLAQSSENVRADITFLRQDFSVCQPVRDHGPWPAVQRFDYLLRTREATPREAALLREAAPATYPQRQAILFALRELTGADHGSRAKDWLAALGDAKPEPLPPWPDRQAVAPLPRGKPLLEALATLGVGPLAKPHLADESPDGKWRARVVGNQIVIAAPGDPQSAIQPPPLSSPITSLWWTLDGKHVCANDAGGIETLYDAASGKQTDAFFRTFRP